MNKLNRLLVAAGLTVASLGVQAETTYEFDSVSSVEYRTLQVLVTGILVNDITPTTAIVSTLNNSSIVGQRCFQPIQTMHENPGIYTLKIVTDLVPELPNPTPVLVTLSCTLTVKP